jgi:hypothetical protein
VDANVSHLFPKRESNNGQWCPVSPSPTGCPAMYLVVALVIGACSVVDPGLVQGIQNHGADSAVGFAPSSCGKFLGVVSREAARCRQRPLLRPAQPRGRRPSHHQTMALESAPDSLYGPVVVEDPVTRLPLLRVSRTTEVVAELEGCKDVRLVNTIGWGDGHHAPTRLCLDFLARHAKGIPGQVFVCQFDRMLETNWILRMTWLARSQTILDYGTGSGVLGIAAAKLGCTSVLGVDIDDEALEAAYENLEENKIDLEKVTSTVCGFTIASPH